MVQSNLDRLDSCCKDGNVSLWNGTPRERAQQVRAEFQIRQRAGLMIYLQQVESCYVLPLRCFSSSDGRKPTGAVQVDPSAAPSRPTAGHPPPKRNRWFFVGRETRYEFSMFPEKSCRSR